MELRIANDSSELARSAEPLLAASPFARARLHRQLTVEEVAKRARIAPDEVRWLEEGRVYRFPSADHALVAALLYAAGLGIEHREALGLAGLPVPPRPLQRNRRGRLLAAVAAMLAAAAALASVLIPGSGHSLPPSAGSSLPPPWRVSVTVLNGSGDINYTRQVASRVQAFGYRLVRVGRADNFGYIQTVVFYPPEAEQLAARLAHQLGVPDRPLPGGSDPRHLIVTVGPASGIDASP